MRSTVRNYNWSLLDWLKLSYLPLLQKDCQMLNYRNLFKKIRVAPSDHLDSFEHICQFDGIEKLDSICNQCWYLQKYEVWPIWSRWFCSVCEPVAIWFREQPWKVTSFSGLSMLENPPTKILNTRATEDVGWNRNIIWDRNLPQQSSEVEVLDKWQ